MGVRGIKSSGLAGTDKEAQLHSLKRNFKRGVIHE